MSKQTEALKRYDMFCSYDGGGPAEEEERANGDWVRYEDAAAELLRQEALIAEMAGALREALIGLAAADGNRAASFAEKKARAALAKVQQ